MYLVEDKSKRNATVPVEGYVSNVTPFKAVVSTNFFKLDSTCVSKLYLP